MISVSASYNFPLFHHIATASQAATPQVKHTVSNNELILERIHINLT